MTLHQLLRKGRLALSVCFLAVTGFLFLDFAGLVSIALLKGVTWIQFIPSLLSFLTLAGWTALGFVVVLLATLLFGRVYCSTVCPLGILQDVFSRIGGFFRSKSRRQGARYRFSAPKNALRYGILASTVGLAFFGSMFLLHLLDPFSIFGKIVSGLVRPLYFLANNLVADVLHSLGSYRLYHVETRGSVHWHLLLPVAMLLVVGFLAVKRGRLYCNTLCPLGSLLGLVARHAMYRIRIEDTLCTHCALCSLNCKAECIDLKKSRIDFTRCVGCFNCLNICSRQGIHFRNHWFPRKDRDQAVENNGCCSQLPGSPSRDLAVVPEAPRGSSGMDGVERRSFLFALLLFAIGDKTASGNLKTSSARREEHRGAVKGIASRPSTIPEKKLYPVSPPGSLHQSRFRDSCTACQLCVSACPTKVLQPSFLEYGFTGMMQPRLDFHASFCNFDCVICGQVCPTGAILSLTPAEKHTIQIGKVHLELENCVVPTEKIACGACSEHCPTQAVRMVPYEGDLTLPEIAPELCVGCGACEYICPTRPYRAIYVDGLPVHAKAIPPVVVDLPFQPPEDDFPF